MRRTISPARFPLSDDPAHSFAGLWQIGLLARQPLPLFCRSRCVEVYCCRSSSESYGYSGSLLRLMLSQNEKRYDCGFELAALILLGIPNLRGPAGAAVAAWLGRKLLRGEITPKNATLAIVKRHGISQRLIGTCGFSDVQRSFDSGSSYKTCLYRRRAGSRDFSTLPARGPTAVLDSGHSA
jgi:hypothetical protein